MSIKQIADRLEAWGKDWVGLDKQMDALQPRRAELVSILADLRALDGKTVLPVEVVEAMTDDDRGFALKTGRNVNGIGFYAEQDRQVAHAATPAAALDALAEEIRRNP